jgi:16S rRNA (guanine527-N7)-methyltransferase
MSSNMYVHPHWPGQLSAGMQTLGLTLSAEQSGQLLDYLALLNKWNRVYNLTAIRDPAQMVRRQLLDSLAIVERVDAGPVLDVGTGAGLPGIPLAIIRPGLAFTLLDTNGKKTRFVQQAVAEIGVANVEVIKSRVEALPRPGHYARITSRAFATLADMVKATAHLLAADGVWLAMKGAAPTAETRDLPPGLDTTIETLRVPGESGSRHLAVIRQRHGARATTAAGDATST